MVMTTAAPSLSGAEVMDFSRASIESQSLANNTTEFGDS
jgi:hypothetical protein